MPFNHKKSDRRGHKSLGSSSKDVITAAVCFAIEPLERRIFLSTSYVDSRATGAGTGADWSDAYTNLQSALSQAVTGETIEVAQGTYKPTTGTSRGATFQLVNGVTLLGGYGGVEASNPNTRNVVLYTTILSGQIGPAGTNTGNTYHVVTANGVNSTAILDGFTISGGNADGTGSAAYGGGLEDTSGSPTINDCTFTANSAGKRGGAVDEYSSSSPTFTDCTFNSNTAELAGAVYVDLASGTFSNCTFSLNVAAESDGAGGGAMQIDEGSPTIEDCVFSGNAAKSTSTTPQYSTVGGGIYVYGSGANPAIINSVFVGNVNSAYEYADGGAIAVETSADPVFTNCTITANQTNSTVAGSSFGGGIFAFNDGSTSTLTNCILWNNTAANGASVYQQSGATAVTNIAYSDVDGGYGGTGNIDADPQFVRNPSAGSDGVWGTADDDDGNLQLQSTSTAIEAGNVASVPNGVTQDVAGNPRFFNGTVSMGAYEFQAPTISWTGGGDGINWNDPNNWSSGSVPNSLDNVVVDAPGTTVDVSTNVTIQNISSTANLNITGGLTVTSGTSSVTGSLSLANGAPLSVSGSGTVFQATGTSNIGGGSLYASGGATLSLPGVSSYGDSNLNGFNRYWQASGAGSEILLSNLTNIASFTNNTLYIQPESGGEVSLPALATIDNSYYVHITASGAGDVINLPALTSFTEYNNTGTLAATGGGQIIDPLLTNLFGVGLTLTGAGSQMNTSQLTSLTCGSITVDQTANFNALTDIDGAELYVSNGATLSLPEVSSYGDSGSNQNGFDRYWQASGAGSEILLSNLTNIASFTNNTLYIQPESGGEVSLPALATIDNSYYVHITASGAGDVINLPALTSFTEYNNTGTLAATGGGQIIDPLLTNLFGVGLTLTGAGSQMNTSQLTSLTCGSITVDQTANFNALTDIDGAELYVSNGATLSLPEVSSYGDSGSNQNGFDRYWQASGAGSEILLSNLTNIASFTNNTLYIQPESGGEVSLPALATIDNSYYVHITASGAGDVINLPALTSFTEYNNTGTLAATGGGQIIDPLLTNLFGVGLTLTGAGSQMNTSQLTSLTCGSITVDQTANFNALTDIDGAELYVSNGATLSLPEVSSYGDSGSNQNGFDRYWQASGAGSEILLSNLTNIASFTNNTLYIQPESGGEVSLPALATIDNSYYVHITASGAGDVINLPALTSFTEYNNTGTLAATGGGVVIAAPSLAVANVGVYFDSASTLTTQNLTLNDGSSLAGAGTLNANVVNNGGTVSPAGSGTAGTLTIAGNYTQAVGGKLQIDIGGTTAGSGYDQLVVTGTTSLNGTLQLGLIGGFFPALSDTFTSITSDSVTGSFSAVTGSGLGQNVELDPSYSSTAVTLTADTAFGPYITSTSLASSLYQPFSSIEVTFNKGIQASTFTSSQVLLSGPGGEITITSVGQISATVFQINFATQDTPGEYQLAIGPDITDFAGDEMDQSQSGTTNGFFASGTLYLDDLTPQDVATSSSAVFGQPISVSWTDRNAGNVATAGGEVDDVYLSNSTSLNSSSVLLGTQSLPATPLSAGGQTSFSGLETLPAPTTNLPAGTYYVIIRSTASGNVAASSAIQISQPALPALSVTSIVPPAQGYSGHGISVSWTVTNSGTASATGSWNDEVYLIPQRGGSAIDLGGLTNPVNLAPGASYTRTDDFTIPDGVSGQYQIEVIANSNSGVLEIPPSNGTSTSSVFPISLSAYPDLQVQSVTVPSSAVAGQTATFNWTVVNNGAGGTDVARWTDDLYLSTTPTLTNAVLLGTAYNPSYLAPGDTYNQSLTATIPTSLSGHYYAIVVTNADHTQYELNGGTDNVGASTSQVDVQTVTSQGFLHVASVTVSPAPPNIDYTGSSVNVSWTVTNTGTTDIAPGTIHPYWTDELVLSPTPTWDGVNGYPLGVFDESTVLTPGSSYTLNASVVLPQVSSSGTWYMVAVPDSAFFTNGTGYGSSTVPRDQGSATLNVQIPPQPLVQVSSVSAGSTVQAGQPIGVSWNVANNGYAATSAGSWQDSVYLSPTSTTTISSSDILLGTTTHTGDLAPTASYSPTQSYTVPADLTGSYYVVVYDSLANSASVSASATSISPEPVSNLSVSNVTPPATADAGQVASVSWTVTNNGPAATNASQWTDQVIVSTTDSTSGEVLDVGTFTHSGALAVGATYTGTSNFQLPDSFSGTYYLIVTTNADSNVNEASGNNNAASATFTVNAHPTADLEVTGVQLPATAASGQPITVAWTVTNGGAAATPSDQTSWVDSVYLSSDGTFSDAALVGTATQNGTLAPGDAYNNSTQITLPNGISGTYTVFVVADSGDSITGDSTTTNHTGSSTLSVQAADEPQLAVSDITAPANVFAGQPITVNWNVNNVGTGATAVSKWTDSVYLSLDQYIDSTSVYLGSVQHSGALAAGGGYSGSLTATVPSQISGPYYVFVVTDSGKVVYQGGQTATNTSFLPTAINVSLAPLTDLTPTTIDIPTTGALGQSPATPISWTVTNDSDNTTSVGQWSDSVYLSTTDTWSSSDPVIATVVHNGDLQPGDSYTASTDAAFPSVIVPGNYYVIVRTDVLNNVRESNETNNTLVSTSTISMIDVPTLTIGSTVNDTIADGQDLYYKVNVQAGQDLVISPTFGSTNAAQFYLRFGAPPTATQFDQVYNDPANLNEQLQVSATQTGSYYILLAGQSGAGSGTSFSITAQTPSFGITSASPAYGSNAGDATVVINGTLLDNKATVTLDNDSTVVAKPIQEWWVNPTTIWAEFDLQGIATGQYSIVAQDGSNTSTLTNAYTVNSGAAGSLQVKVVPPGTVRPNSTDQVEIQYTNVGYTDICAPLLDITGTSNISFENPGQSTYSSSVEILGVNNTGPAGILPPGVTGTVTLTFKGPAGAGSYYITATPITGTTAAINWDSFLGPAPANVPASAWTVMVNNLVGDAGDTWNDYDEALSHEATYLSQLGEVVDNVSDLTTFIIGQAAGSFGAQTLASATDFSVPGVGPSLSLSRSYASPLFSRNAIGSFGYGWTYQWETSLKVDSSGNVVISDGNGGQQFLIQSNGSYVGPASDSDSLVLQNGLYLLQSPDGGITTYNSAGQLVSTQDSHGNSIRTVFTGSLLTGLIDSDGQTATFSYNSDGRIILANDSAGDAVTYTYDSTGDYLLSVTNAHGSTAYTYSTAAGASQFALASITFPGGTHEYFNYDSEGRLAGTSQDGGLNAVSYFYDQPGEIIAADALGDSTESFYDNRGLLIRSVDALGDATVYGYDPATLLVNRITNAANQTEALSYNSLGDLLQTVDPLGNTNSYTYGVDSQITSLTDANGNVTKYNYDSKGNLLSITYADSTTSSSTFNPEGQAVSFLNQNGQMISYTYNSEGLLASETFPGDQYTYTYDSHGDMLTASDSTGTTTFTYNSSLEMTEVLYPDGMYLKFTYNAAGQRTQMVDQTGFTTNYQYNADGELAGLTDGNGSPIVTYTYNAAGELTGKVNGNGTYTTYSYDANGNVLRLFNYMPGGSVNSSFVYTYNLVGLETSETTIDGAWTYSYDADGELTHAVFTPNSTDPDGLTAQNLIYNYDAMGNRTSTTFNGTTTLYTVNDMNEYTSVGGVSYSYDADGNLLSDGSETFQYNPLNQQTAIVQGNTDYTFSYDSLGVQVESSVNGVTTFNLVDPFGAGDLVAQQNASGGTIAAFRYGIGLSSLIVNSQVFYFDYDRLGSVAALTDSIGSEVEKYLYSPFGANIHQAGNGSNQFEFLGEAGVSVINGDLLSMHARCYSLTTGRFTTRDPLSILQPNLYAYASNSPTIYIDPTGLVFIPAFPITYVLKQFIPMTAVVGGAVGGALTVLLNPSSTAGPELDQPPPQDPASRVPIANPDIQNRIDYDTLMGNYNGPTVPDLPPYDDPSQNAGDGSGNAATGEDIDWGNWEDWGSNDPGGEQNPTQAPTPTNDGDNSDNNDSNNNDDGSNDDGSNDDGSNDTGTDDTGSNDTGSNDTGSNDDGSNDTGSNDTGSNDTGSNDDGSNDTGSNTSGSNSSNSGNENSGPAGPDGGPQGPDGGPGGPGPGGGGGGGGGGSSTSPNDPNDLVGPMGYGNVSFIGGGQTMPYRIDFVNESTATAPAQTVAVTDQLPTSVNWQTFQLGQIVFGSNIIDVPAGRSFYDTVVPVQVDGVTLDVDIDAGIDPTTGIVHWTFTTIDPATNEPPTNPLEGFLPPDDAAGDGEADVTYAIDAATNLPTGTPIDNQATITFDTQPPISTNQTVNTLDSVAPTSTVAALPAQESSNDFTVNWSGTDDTNGSGVANYNIYVSTNGQPYTIWQQGVTATSAIYDGQAGNTYSFYSVATDNAGNIEATPASGQATTTVAKESPTLALPATPTLTYDGTTDVISWAQPTLTGASGVAAPTGTPSLLFYAGSSATGTPLPSLPINTGTYTVIAEYAGDGNYAAVQSSPVTFTIARANSTTTLGTPPALITADGTTDVTSWVSATVVGVTGAPAPGSASYTYYSGSTATGTPLTASPTTAGTYTVVATYAGNSNYLPSIASTAFTIKPAAASALTTTMLVNGVPSTGPVANTQRSQVTSLVINFSAPVTLAAGAITLTDQDASNPFGSAGASVPYTLTSSNGGMTYTLTFSGSGFVNRGSLATSLPNGHYIMSVNYSLVSSATATVPTGTQSLKFHRLYGDLTNAGYITTSAARTDGTAATWTADQQYLDNDGASLSGGFDSADSTALTAAEAFVSGTQEQSLWSLFNN